MLSLYVPVNGFWDYCIIFCFLLLFSYCCYFQIMGEETRQYFAVYIPTDVNNSTGDSSCCPSEASSLGVVCNTLQEADNLVKKFEIKGARFKKFTDFNEAKSYVLYGNSATPTVTKTNNVIGSPYPSNIQTVKLGIAEEKPPPFPSVSRSDLNLFRKAVEQKDHKYVDDKVYENPRYLINYNNDSPMILHEGCRYNAMHYASKANNLHVCKLIVDLFTDIEYVQKLYPDDSFATMESRREFLLDRYLNTPDKAFNETPLHFAAKNGYAEIVKLLISVPGCQKDPRNKYGETPADLAHSRCAEALIKSPQLKLCLEEDVAYVPLYRSDNSHEPILKHNCIGFPSVVLTSEESGATPTSRIVGNPRLVAFAGPMSVETAKKYHAEWSSHKQETKTYNLRSVSSRVKRIDVHKGMEQLGRRLAFDYGVDWAEYWDFLKTLCDIRQEDGLRLLENYFKNKICLKRKFSADDLFVKIKALSSDEVKNGPTEESKNCCRTKLDFFEEEPVQSNDECEIFYDTVDDQNFVSDENELYNETNDVNYFSNGDDSEVKVVINQEEDSLDGCDFATPPETPPTVYIYGDWPTKTDLDVFLALENVTVDQFKFPNVYRWLSRISKCSNEEQFSWPALDSPRMKKTLRRRSKD